MDKETIKDLVDEIYNELNQPKSLRLPKSAEKMWVGKKITEFILSALQEKIEPKQTEDKE